MINVCATVGASPNSSIHGGKMLQAKGYLYKKFGHGVESFLKDQAGQTTRGVSLKKIQQNNYITVM